MRAIQVNVQIYPQELDQVEGWRKAQPGFPSRAAALRNFISLGLKASLPEKSSTKERTT